MSELSKKHPAEEFLLEAGLIAKPSPQRRAALNCIGCRWLVRKWEGEEPTFYGFEVAKCAVMEQGVVYPILKKLGEADVMKREREAVNPTSEGLPPRILYSPTESAIGRGFLTALQVPDECPLEEMIAPQPEQLYAFGESFGPYLAGQEETEYQYDGQ